MTGEQLQEELENARLRLLEALSLLPDEAFLQPGVVGDHSLRDWLFLLTAWEAELVTGLMRVKQGKKPERLLAALDDRPAYEARRLAENPDRDLDLIFDDLQGVRIELEDWLEQFSDKHLNDPRRFPWLAGQALVEIIAAASFQNEARYLPVVEAFAAAWNEAENAPPTISLDTIEVNHAPHHE